ncbi:predicted protein [Sclerotinia sclerotiorum 1980 UF-70]|uniref:Uncharacterized protein n=1 Tax=Sclerotinia sclerotiorum (strain ATCC 18683 / 1980 / Ss-1) TaxID=665079 RepID=A7ENJ5_SCLS1|nr:predicted protein [Sclerotinia sclerotiorum 1980 UF-70]EDO04411.1 predicted protein [Sclerotinia sclerotiorum 1980 UF-70]
MARILAPIVRYNDSQWRAIKSKANNNHSSLKPEDIEIIKEVIRVHNAILNNTDPTPLPQFQDSIRYDERQVIRYFLWSRVVRENNSTFTLISTYYLPKRRPQGWGSKQQKQADEAMRPRRDSRGTTYGFVRRPERKVDDAVEDTAVESGEPEGSEVAANEDRGDIGVGSENGTLAMGTSPHAKQNPTGENSSGGERRIRRLKLKSNTSHEFVRRSERRIGGEVANKNLETSMEGTGEFVMNENTDKTKGMSSLETSQDSTDSKGSSESTPSDEMNDTLIENGTLSNNTFVAEDNKHQDSNSNSNTAISAQVPEEDMSPSSTNKLPYDPFSNAGYQIEECDSSLTFLGLDWLMKLGVGGDGWADLDGFNRGLVVRAGMI